MEFVAAANVAEELCTKATMGHMESYACGEKQRLSGYVAVLSLKQEASADFYLCGRRMSLI